MIQTMRPLARFFVLAALAAMTVSAFAQASTGGATQNPPAVKPPKHLNNVFVDSDLKTVIQEIGNAGGASIIADSSVKGTEINFVLKNDTIESALDKLSDILGLVWKKRGDTYLVSTGAPGSPLFDEFAETRVYVPKTQSADSLFALLSQSYRVYAELDKAANLISITAPTKRLDAVMASLAKADCPRKQFVVEAMVTEVSAQSSSQSGFSWSWRYFAQDAMGGLSYGMATAGDIASMKSLIDKGTAKLKANPKIMATEGREASITVGNETYFALVSGSQSYATVQYQRINTGITLKFTGYVDNGEINLHVQPEVSDAATPVNGNPSMTVRKADTYLRLKFGETVALGGLVQDVESSDTSKIPLLGDLPVVGKIFQNKTKSHKKTEVIIFLTPRMIEDAMRPTAIVSTPVKVD